MEETIRNVPPTIHKKRGNSMASLSYVPIILGVFGLFCAFLLYISILKKPAGTGKVVDIGDQIHLGAMVFMKAEYSRLAIFCLLCILALGFTIQKSQCQNSRRRTESRNSTSVVHRLFRWFDYGTYRRRHGVIRVRLSLPTLRP